MTSNNLQRIDNISSNELIHKNNKLEITQLNGLDTIIDKYVNNTILSTEMNKHTFINNDVINEDSHNVSST
ncbi:unnamed protein product [Rotaria sp. Silwood2]|nr:unnamed protein product [Rotaria sp. Silwood2]